MLSPLKMGADSPVNTGREQLQKAKEATSLPPENEEQFLSTASEIYFYYNKSVLVVSQAGSAS